MKKLPLVLAAIGVIAVFAGVQAQQADFASLSKVEKIEMLKAYARKDVDGFRKHMDIFAAAYSRLDSNEKKSYDWHIHENSYLLADLYALKGDKNNAITYLEKSENYDYND